MFLLKKVLYFILVLSLLTTTVSADINFSQKAVEVSGVATEYYSSDLFSEPTDFAATVPMKSIPEIKAKSYILMEKSSGEVICENNSDEKLSPASITKIMTLLLVVEAIDSGKISLSDVVSTSEHAASMGGSQIWLEVGEEMTVDELLKATAVASANDASVALAEFVAGSEDAFVGLMNDCAKKLGMKNTVFKNACGLDEEGHYSSARDVAIMSKELLKHDTIKKYTNIWQDSLRNGKTELVNTNKLVRFYQGTTGLKTGTTNKAGFCLAASAMRDGVELISVVMGAENSNDRFNSAKNLLNFGFANYTIFTPTVDAAKIATIPVVKGEQNQVEIESEPIKEVLIKKGSEKGIITEITLENEIEAPVAENKEVGKITIKSGEKTIGEYKIYTINSVERISWPFSFKKIVNLLFSL